MNAKFCLSIHRRKVFLFGLIITAMQCATAFAAVAVPTSEGALSETQLARLIEGARSDLIAAAGRLDTAANMQHLTFARAVSEPHPGRREAMFSIWLREFVGPAPAEEPDADRLYSLIGIDPVVFVQHHDHPDRARPAFNVSGLARNRLTEQTIRHRAGRLRKQAAAIQQALLSPEHPTDFRAALLAMDMATPAVRGNVLASDDAAVMKRARGAEARLALIGRGWIDPAALIDLISDAERRIALRALRMSRAYSDKGARSLYRGALRAALQRPELGGLPVGLAIQVGDPALVELIWPLLGEPERGADAALALARHATDLEQRIETAFDTAPATARTRMLLALKLRHTPQSQLLLESLMDQRLTPSERNAVEAWR